MEVQLAVHATSLYYTIISSFYQQIPLKLHLEIIPTFKIVLFIFQVLFFMLSLRFCDKTSRAKL